MQKKITEIFESLRASSGLVGGAVALIRNGKVDTWFFGHSDAEICAFGKRKPLLIRNRAISATRTTRKMNS